MALLFPEHQTFYDTKNSVNVGIHKVKLASASDTVTVPQLADTTTPDNSVAQLDDGQDDSGVTVATSDNFTVTLIGGTAGNTVWFVSRHNMLNHQVEV